jgi:putative ABC transport system permease protein
MLRTTFSNLAARKLRLLSTGLAVILGVAFMAGTLVLTDTIGRTFDSLFADVNTGVDAYVRADEVTGEGGMQEQRARLDATTLDLVAGVDGVQAAEPAIQGYGQLLDADGQPIGGGRNAAPTLAANWIEDDRLNPFDLAEGRAPAGSDEIVIDGQSAEKGRLAIGDSTGVLTQGGRVDAEIVGISRFGGTDAPAGASFVHFDLPTAQQQVASPGQIDAVRVTAEAGVREDDLVDRIAAVAPVGVEVLTGAEITAENQDSIAEGLSFFNTFLMSFAVIALFVGSFIIYNTFSILVAQRGRETALLRAIGASRRQVLASILGEATAVGLVCSAIGLAAGIGVARLLEAVLSAAGIDIPTADLIIARDTIVVSMLLGVTVCIAAAVLPALRASRVAPIAAMRDVHEDARQSGRIRLVSGTVLAAAGTASLLGGLSGGGGITMVGLGVAVIFVAVSVLGPTLARPITRLLGAPLARLRGLTGGLARENAMRNPRRTSATASALMVGVGLVAAITVFASSAKASVEQTIGEAFTGDVVVESGAMGAGGLDPQLAQDVTALPEAGAVTSVRSTTVEVDGDTQDVYAADPATLGGVIDLGAIDGALDRLGDRQVGVSEAAATDRGLSLGDPVTVRFADTGEQELTVAAIFAEDELVGDYLLGLRAYEANVIHQLDSKVFVTAADGVSLPELKAAVVDAAADQPHAEVQDRDEFAEATGASIDQMLNLVYALLLLAIVIALIGIANTLALSIIERTRELGLLRAVGMSRRQMRATVRWESVLVALLGTVVGLAVGTGFGWALVGALADQGIHEFVVPGAQLVAIAVLAGAAGVLAAILPARKASRLDILKAIAAS